jgi:Fe-S cluster assembly iron-binding protein IscA
MVHVTDRARAQLKATTDRILEESERRLRLGPTADGQLGVYPDRAQDGDQVVEHDGVAVLLIGRDLAQALTGRMIDFEERDSGSRFTLKARS